MKHYEIYKDMLKQPHLLIAGATGSGKSVIINGLINELIDESPEDVELILIDPKRVELVGYRELPHVLNYASEKDEIEKALKYSVDEMESRYQQMQAEGIRRYEDGRLYIIIDELADLLTTSKKKVLPLIQRIAQLGRAAEIHLIMATQRPTKDILSGQLKVNLDSRVALRVPTGVDSRNIINVAGAENLPRYGEAYYLTPETMHPVRIKVPYYSDEEISAHVELINEEYEQLHPKQVKRSSEGLKTALAVIAAVLLSLVSWFTVWIATGSVAVFVGGLLVLVVGGTYLICTKLHCLILHRV